MSKIKNILVLIVVLSSFQSFGEEKLKQFGMNLGFNYVETDTPEVNLPFPIVDQNNSTTPNQNRFDLNLPQNVQTDIRYNPKTGMYDVYQKIGDHYYRYPTSMTRQQYLNYLNQQALNNRIFEMNQDENQSSQDLIPSLKVGGKGFDNVFGGDEISIRPQGSAELRFGVNVSLYKNPVLPIKQQRVTTFDFQQNIQLNLVGQIGDKLKIEIAQNTQATFNFKNQVKIGFTGYEDDIIQKIEAGNVTLPLNTTLIQGSQSLFGIRTDLKFGRLTVQTILSQQKGKRQEINVAGGAQIQDFEVTADNYEANKHYFLNFYHREHYDEAMATMPYVNSGVSITKIEVWVTNRVNMVENTRNIIGFTDLGETKTEYLQNPNAVSVGNNPQEFPENDANTLYDDMKNNPLIRDFSNAVSTLTPDYSQSIDYEKVENARQLSEQEFSYNALLGYISLKQPLNQDEVLAVAYQYTYQGRTYQVGEFSNDVPVEEGSKTALILKLLKPTVVNPQNKIWDLMMKNVYSIGAYNVGPQDFKLDVWYNNPKTSVDVNYLPYDGVDDKILIQYLDLDRLNLNTEAYADGRFDFVPFNMEGNKVTNGGTIDTKTGRIYFTTVEPFGRTLQSKLEGTSLSPFEVDRISFNELYDSTKTAAQQIPSKNRFRIKGSYKSSVSSDISLNALNIPEGSVTVTAGGVKLTEGVDYTVDYNLGRVKILNQGILEAQTPIKVQLESNSVFGFNSKSMVGAHFNYEFNKDFNWGATVINLTEKPLTQKVNVGNEPISNTVLGTDVNFRREAPILTKMVDFLPVISTKEKSYITASGEFAYLIPGTQRAIGQGGISYIDAFEGSQSAINLSNFGSWKLASIPQGQPNLFPEASIKGSGAGTGAGFNRSLLAWYVIDPSAFYLGYSTTPDHIKNNDSILNDSRMRMVSQQELFPQSQPPVGTLNNIPVFDLAFYPKERGPYNYDTTTTNIDNDGLFTNPEDRWGGIMRSLTTTNFEQANVQYIQFWLLDPYNTDATADGTQNMDDGYLYFNLGNISEDILPDSRKSFENGNPTSSSLSTADYDETDWAMVSNQQVIVYAFDNNAETRIYQDIGFDGFDDEGEKTKFASYVNWINSSPLTPEAKAKMLNDVSSDNFNYYLDDDYDAAEYDILRRYKYYNGTEGNSPTSQMTDTMNVEGYPAQSTTVPDVEDLNQDNNLSESENYYQYKIPISPTSQVVGQNFITNKQVITLDNGKTETWYQYKIPITKYDQVVNGISDFRAIRFMRMYVKGFENEKVLRFAKLELIRGTWREYTKSLSTGEQIITDPNSTTFEISAVNLEENESKTPVNYAIPPGIARQNDFNSINQRQLNEQSLSLTVCGLKDGDSRATYKNLALDVRSYGKIEMFVHCEAKDDENLLKDNDLTLFVRIGTDFENNYYEYELPMKLTPWGTTYAQDGLIWPEENNVVIDLDSLIYLKTERDLAASLGNTSTQESYSMILSGNRVISVKGNPTLSDAKVIMVGVRNPDQKQNDLWPDDGLEKCAEVWVNELRLTNFKQNDGWASTAKVNMQLADFGNVALAGNYSTPGWGSIEKKVSERQREFQKGFNVTSNFEMGQFFGRKIGIQLPMYLSYSADVIDPQFDLAAPDVELKEYDPSIRKNKLLNSRTITTRRSMNFTNVRKERTNGKAVHFWDIENFSFTYSYNELYRRDFNTEQDRTKTYRGGLNYSFSAKPKLIEPFKKVSFIKKSKWLRLVRDFNFYLGPKAVTFNNDLQRMYNVRQNRNALDTNFIFLPTYYKTFTWNRTYNFKYDISKGIKFNFNANNQSIVLEPQGLIDSDAQQGSEGYNNSILYNEILRKTFNPFEPHDDSIKFGGFNKSYGHNFDLSYKVPFNKFPLTSWINTNVKYRGSYDWSRAPLSQPNFGNTIQNSRNFTVNGKFNFVTLYNKVDYLKRINNGGKASTRPTRGGSRSSKDKGKETDSKKKDEEKKKKEKKDIHPVVVGIGQAIMSVRNVSFNYSITDGILMPGFNGQTQLLGLDNSFGAPSFGFVAGQQNFDLFGNPVDTWGADSAFAPFAASHNWLVKNPDLNTQHTVMHTQNYSVKASLEPFKHLSVNLSMSRQYSENQNSYYRWSENEASPGDSLFQFQNPMDVGNLNFTTITWPTAFTKLDTNTYGDKTFNNMLALRPAVSNVLGAQEGTTIGSDGYSDGFSQNQQDVLIGAFIGAYTGKGDKATNPFKMMPLPNWDIRYDGLSKYKFMKKYVRNFTLKHAYRSTMSISNFQTNLAARDIADNHLRDQSNNFIADYQIKSITLSEQFAPFLGVDATWIIKKNGLITKFEYKRDRTISMNIPNAQITEMRGREWVFGTGYKFSQIKMPFKFMGKTPKSDLNIRFDLSIRNNVTLSRNIIENTAQATSGQNMYSIKSSVDYNLGPNLNVSLYFDRVVNNPVVSTAYKTANTRAGIALRFNLAG
ncbi:MAG: T9SS outer membrane translocon Sov/SprA [Putridiphycobacter sp.]